MNKIKICPLEIKVNATQVDCSKNSIASLLSQNSASEKQDISSSLLNNTFLHILWYYTSNVKKYISNISIVKDILKDTISLLFFIFCVFVIRLSINILIPIQHPFIREISIIIDEVSILSLQLGLLLIIIKHIIIIIHSIIKQLYELIKEFKKIQRI